MRALHFTGSGALQLGERATPAPGPGELRIRVLRASICGTDLHKLARAAEQQDFIAGQPCTAGHEPAGIVEAVGAGVSAARIGERVLVAGVIGCGQCRHCQAGFEVACEQGPSGLHWSRHGGNADFLVWPATHALRLPEGVSLDTAAVLACAGGTAMTCWREAQVRAGMRLAVIGLGPVGLCAVILARALGCTVLGVEPDATRRALAEELGAQTVADASSLSGFDAVAECAGKPASVRSALQLAGQRGAVALAGLGAGPVPIAPEALIGRSLRLIGIAATPLPYFHELLALAAQGLPFERLISHRFALADAEQAFAVAASGRCAKVLLSWDQPR